jgi:hypothetical protein
MVPNSPDKLAREAVYRDYYCFIHCAPLPLVFFVCLTISGDGRFFYTSLKTRHSAYSSWTAPSSIPPCASRCARQIPSGLRSGW